MMSTGKVAQRNLFFNQFSRGTHRPNKQQKYIRQKLYTIERLYTIACLVGIVFIVSFIKDEAAADVTALEVRAAYYITFREDIDLVQGMALSSEADTRLAHERLAGHDPDLLASGWVAYAALVAADTPAFSQALEAKLSGKEKATTFLEELSSNPTMIVNLPGASDAIDAILQIASSDAQNIDFAGDEIIENSRQIYRQSWAKRKISDGTSRVDRAASFAYSRAISPPPTLAIIRTKNNILSPNLAGAPASWATSWSPHQVSAYQTSRSIPITTRALILAAKYATDTVTPGLVSAYAKGTNSSHCVRMAQLNFAQCIAATRTPYEETFCIGTHGMKEISQCIGWVAGIGS